MSSGHTCMHGNPLHIVGDSQPSQAGTTRTCIENTHDVLSVKESEEIVLKCGTHVGVLSTTASTK